MDAASTVPAPMIATSLALYLALYAVLIAAFISVVFYLARKGSPSANAPSPVASAGVQP